MKHLSLIFGAILALSGCSDDDNGGGGTGGTCVNSSDCPTGQSCVDSQCKVIDSGEVGFTGNDSTDGTDGTDGVDGSTMEDVVEITDEGGTTGAEDVTVIPDPGPAPDLIPDTNAPTLSQSLPSNGDTDVAVNSEIQLVFSETVKNVDKNTVQLTGPDDEPVEMTFSKDSTGQNWTLKPATILRHTSKYTVTVNFPTQVILDNAGNKFQGVEEIIFYTAPPSNLDKYNTLAAKYAPMVRLQTQQKAMYDYPTVSNIDGDWDLANNKAFLDDPQTKELAPALHYTVFESESHYFIHYAAFWSVHNLEGVGGSAFQNDIAGLTVVVEKWPEERPVEALTWFKQGASEYMRAFTTTESGILDGDGDDQGITEAVAQETLFANDRVDLFFTAGQHTSCLWNEPEATGCDIPEGDKALLGPEVIMMEPGTTATVFQKNGAQWPRATADATGTDENAVYILGDMLSTWWVRRNEVGTVFHDAYSTLSHDGGGDEPVTVTFPRWFVDGDGDQGDGRAPWAFQWKPGDNTPYVDLPIGQFFLDTANFLKSRHVGSAYVNAAFSAEAKTGFSVKYCYNPYLEIDIRGTGDVCPE